MKYLEIAVAASLLLLLPLPADEGIQSRAIAPWPYGSSVEYLIVTTEALSEGFRDLADWKNSLGIHTSIATIETILADSPGRDDAEKLLSYLSTHDANLSYLLLGGDAEIVPTRYLHADAGRFGLDDEYLSDVYYASPWTDWDPDGDSVFGEPSEIDPNMTFPVSVGRVPASNLAEVEEYVGRVIRYESSPPKGDWFNKAILTSSLMDRPNIIDDPGTQEDEGYEDGSDNGYLAIQRVKDIMPYSMVPSEAHDYTFNEGGRYDISNDTLTLQALPEMITGGAAMLTFAGQSFYDADVHDPPTAYSLAQWFEPTGTINMTLGFQPALSSGDLPNLTNGGMLPVAYLSSCDSANFSDPTDSDLSNIIFAPEGGAICMIGSTGISWRGEYEEGGYGNWYLLPMFWEGFYASNMPGQAMTSLRGTYLRSYFGYTGLAERVLAGLYGYNYMGDPSLVAWTQPPRGIDLSFSPSAIHAGGEDLNVSVITAGGSPLYNARISVWKEGHPPFVAYTDQDGKARVPTFFTEEGTARVTASKTGYLPSSGNLTVLEWPPDLNIEPGSLRIGPERPTASKSMVITITVGSEGGPHTPDVAVRLYPGIVTGQGPVPAIMDRNVTLAQGGSVEVEFEILSPQRTWSHMTVIVGTADGEIDLEDNILSFPVSINGPPMVLPSNITLDEDTSIFYDLSDAVLDPDDAVEDLTFVLGAGSPDWIELSSVRFLMITPPANWSGDADLPILVSDGLESGQGTLRVSVTPFNDPPVLSGLPGTIEARADEPIVIDLEPEDAEGEVLDIRIVEGPEGMTVSGYALRFIPAPEQVGNHTLVINVSDPGRAFSLHTAVVVVLPANDTLHFEDPSVRLPRARAGQRYERTIKIGGSLAESAVFSDNTSLFDIDPVTGRISFTPVKGDEGEHWVRISVTSGDVTISRAFILVVEKEDKLPSWVQWAMIAVIAILVLVVVALYLWPGRRVPQYGLEE